MGNSQIWRPFTQHEGMPELAKVERGEGAHLYTQDGRDILDAISSWWVNLHGHSHPRIAAAIAEQASKLEHVIFAGFTHDPAEQLTEKLLKIAPKGLEHVFFSDNGSTAVEISLKMAVGYWANKGQPNKFKLVAMDNGYHGDTCGAMSVSAPGAFTDMFKAMTFPVERIPFPKAGEEAQTVEAYKKLLERDADSLAAIILEPLVLGAGGMKMYPPWVLKELYDLSKKHDVLFILDEVMTGFGRTGTMFACEQANISPDIMALAKGITGGFLPLATTLTTDDVFMGFYNEDRSKAFYHGHSYTGNPIGCAAAVANLEIFEQEDVMGRIKAISDHHAVRLKSFHNRSEVEDVRQTGVIAAMTLTGEGGYLDEAGQKLKEFYIENNVLLRPLGNVVYILQPYCMSLEELDKVYDVIEASLDILS